MCHPVAATAAQSSHPVVVGGDPPGDVDAAHHAVLAVLGGRAALDGVVVRVGVVVDAQQARVGEGEEVLVLSLVHVHVRVSQPQGEVAHGRVLHPARGEGAELPPGTRGPLADHLAVVDALWPPVLHN